MSHKSETVARVLIRRVGVIKASQLMTFITLWWIEEELVGEGVDVEHLVEENYFSRPTAFRRQQLFREAFEPEGLKTPHDLALLLPDRTKSALQSARIVVA